MKKTKLINSNISNVIANLGHTDMICISDAGLPVPKNVDKIDLAVKLGIPSFIDVLETISEEAKFEKVFIAKEILEYYPQLIKQIQVILGNDCLVEMISHSSFKDMLPITKAVIRTGENKWYHNIIIQSGVTF